MTSNTVPLSVTPSRSSPTLTSLPLEVLTNVAARCDKSTALSLARTSKYLTTCVEERLWRELPIFIPHGTLWRLRKEDCGKSRESNIHRVAIKAKLSKILALGNEMRWRMVESVGLCVRPGSAHGMVYLLDCVAPYLRRLRIDSGDTFDNWRSIDIETIDIPMLTARLSFPLLTHLRLGPKSLRFAQSIAIFCNAAPSLISLDVDLCNELATCWTDKILPRFPKVRAKNGIRELRLRFSPLTNADPHNATEAYQPIISLLEASPQLRRLELRCLDHSASEEEIMSKILLPVSAHEHLSDLYCGAAAKHFDRVVWSLVPYAPFFPALRRVIFKDMHSPSAQIYRLSFAGCRQLEIAILDGSMVCLHSTPRINSAEFRARSPKTRSMVPNFAANIRSHPVLRILAHDPNSLDDSDCTDVFEQLDKLEVTKAFTGTVASYRYGDEELLHARLFLKITEICDEATDESDDDSEAELPEGKFSDTSTFAGITYEGEDYETHRRTFEYMEKAMWLDHTDLGGRMIPVEVIERMRIVEGATAEQWDRRGVKVSHGAWKVLQDWIAQDSGEAVAS